MAIHTFNPSTRKRDKRISEFASLGYKANYMVARTTHGDPSHKTKSQAGKAMSAACILVLQSR
ncbi:hypothetical protein I79_010070 [Cricetulus griseus]|uniref:Uncharacterized protein n=1 Tax=Cricetulus griseus TaxID=10029 RepID=G3HHG8_CRIGR|nr:hypothetical protein I79_010070 [Cricetulus griseus]